jgi:alpha-tubulin suppressor-like RCC1 family protein
VRRIWLASFVLFGACLSPTQIDVVITSDACPRIRLTDGVKLYFSTPMEIDDDALAETAVAHTCDGTRIGDIVVVPSHRTGDVAIRVVADVDGPDSCKKKDGYKGCIVARRILRFVDHTPLVVPISLDASCVDVACDSMSTCVNGGCVPATVDPSTCARPGGCTPDGGPRPTYTIDWLEAGRTSTCMRISTGKIYCWGYDMGSGSLGLAPGPNLAVPTLVPALEGAKQISIGGTHGCAVDKDGLLACWGTNDLAQQGIGSVTSTVYAPAHNPTLGAILSVKTGYGHTCAVAPDSSVWCWGLDNHYQAGVQNMSLVPAKLAVQAPFVAAGQYHTCVGAGGGGTIRCWGSNSGNQSGGTVDTFMPTSVQNIAAPLVATGEEHSCGAAGDTVMCWGDPQKIVGSGLPTAKLYYLPSAFPIDILEAAEGFNCAHVQSGQVFCWGANGYGQLGNGTSGTAVPLSMGTQPVPIGKPVLGVTAGVGHVCAWTKTEAWCWGSGALGQVGHGMFTSPSTPTPIVLP